jgi:release factor glutamine methyltransferase
MLNQEEQWLLQEKYNGEKSEGFFTDCERLKAGEPLAYIIGHIPFLGCTIYLDSHPLIPRPETEYWVEKAIKIIKNDFPRQGLGKNVNILDLCAGSGCIGVAVGKAISEANITFAEIDPTHLPTINKNCTENTVLNITTVESNLFESVSGTFDYIFSNPPYIDPALDRTETSVKNHEPHLALYGGQDGSKLILSIIASAPAFLNPQGELWLEHEPEQLSTIQTAGTAEGFLTTHHPDQFGTLRYSRLVLQ